MVQLNLRTVLIRIQVLAINSVAVTIAMYCIIQFYVQMKQPLKEHRPFLKVLAIKLVIFLSFWQVSAVAVATNERFKILEPNDVIAYPDIKIGSPAAVLCFEMALFAALHIWAYPYAPYVPGANAVYYPSPDDRKANVFPPKESVHLEPSGGTLGLAAFADAMNPWDFVKAFGRGMRWLFCGVRRRKEDPSYSNDGVSSLDLDNLRKPSGPKLRSTEHLPIADEFRRSRFALNLAKGGGGSTLATVDEDAGLIAHAQPNPTSARAAGGTVSSSQSRNGPSYGGQSGYSGNAAHYDSPPSAYSGNGAQYDASSSYAGNAAQYHSPSAYGGHAAQYNSPSAYAGNTAQYGAQRTYGNASPLPSPSPLYHDQASRSFDRTGGRGGGGTDWEPNTPGGGPPGRYGTAF